MHPSARLLRVDKNIRNRGICKKRVILDGIVDPRGILLDNTSGANRQMTYFAVAKFTPFQTNGGSGGLQKSHRVMSGYEIECWLFGVQNRISGAMRAVSPSIEYCEYNWLHIFYYP